MKVADARKELDRRVTVAATLVDQLESTNKRIASVTDLVETDVKSQWVITEVARATQQKFAGRVEALVNKAIKAVFSDRDFRFKLSYSAEGTRPMCNLQVFEGEDEEPFEPKDEMGVGLLNVISVTLRPVLLVLERPAKRRLLVLDEPFTALGDEEEMLTKAGEMLRFISHELDIQVILNTHSPSLKGIADASWHVTYNGQHSVVTQVKGAVQPTRRASA